jgi:signal transduction histidine kinase
MEQLIATTEGGTEDVMEVRNHMNTGAKTQDSAVSRGTALLAHELREPLAAIQFAVECTNEVAHDASANREMCGLIARQVQYLAGIIEDVLDLSRGGKGGFALRKEMIDIRFVIAACTETTARLFVNRRHLLSISLPDEPVYMHADPLRLQQVINNLLTNAARYTQPGGDIHLEVTSAGDSVVLEFRDNGIGIAPDLLSRVFDLYHQCGEERSRSFGGLGIGLALVKLIVELHGGSVTAHSDGEGCGSLFIIRLPGIARLSTENPDLIRHATALLPASRTAGGLCLPGRHSTSRNCTPHGGYGESHSLT